MPAMVGTEKEEPDVSCSGGGEVFMRTGPAGALPRGHEVIGEAEDVAVKLFQADRVLDEIARALA